MKNKGSLTKTISVVALIVTIGVFLLGDGVIIKKIEHENNLLLQAQEYSIQKDYERMAQTLSNDALKNNAYAALNIGVMYANGNYFKQNEEIARDYFYKALDKGEKAYSIIYLLSSLDFNADEDEMKRIFRLGCTENNPYCEELLQRIYDDLGESPDGILTEHFNNLSREEQKKIEEEIFLEVNTGKTYSQWEVEEYEYFIDENHKLTAKAKKIKENVIPIKAKINRYLIHEYDFQFPKA